MKFSLNLAQYYSNVDLKDLGTDEIVKRLGLQLGSIESVEDYKRKYKGVVVAKIVSCEKHPNADKLNICFIDDGGATENVERNASGNVQVVCGAPNAREGILVAWIPPAVAVPSSYGDDDLFVLEARELRGKISNGMLASPRELAMGEEHEGILEITDKDIDGVGVAPGTAFSNLYGLDDVIIDCENKMFTHRPDCFGNLGIARELAGIFGLRYESPDWYTDPVIFREETKVELDVVNPIKNLVPRFTVIAMDDIKVGPSPMRMQGFLRRAGIKPINNVVDITNYVMHLTGQPLHAFDYDKLEKLSDSPSLLPRMAKKGETLALLNGKTIELDEKDMVIATDKRVVALAGVMGGTETEVDENTNTIVIECATFDMYAVRRTSMRHGLFTDAVTRFNKGQSPLQNTKALGYAVKLMEGHTSAQQASSLYDLAAFDLTADNLNHVTVTSEFINERLGTNLLAIDMKRLLENVEFIVSIEDDILTITAPFWRMDITIKEDIVEEIGRLYGYENVPVVLPLRSSKPVPKNQMREFKQQLRDKLTLAGANEVLTYSFVHGDLLRNTGTDPDKWAYHVRNALSPDLQYFRTSLTPSLLAKVRSNIKAQAGTEKNEFALFEIGKVHVKGHNEEAPEENLPKQMRRLAFVVAADAKTSSNKSGSAFYKAKKYVDLLTNGQAIYLPLDTNEYPVVSSYEQGRSAVIVLGEQVLGVVGEFTAKARKTLKLPDYIAGFEADLDFLQAHVVHPSYKKLSSYPSSSQDMTYEVLATTKWAEVDTLLRAELAVASAESGYDWVLKDKDIYQAKDSKNMKRFSFTLELTQHDKTLKTSEVNELLEQIDLVLKTNLDATRV